MKVVLAFLLGVACTFAVAATQQKTLESRVRDLERQYLDFLVAQSCDKRAELKADENGFDLVQTPYGAFACTLADVAAFAAGTKVRVRILNLTSVGLGNCTYHVSWIRKVGKTVPAQYKEPTVLHSGLWTDLEFKNTEVTPVQLSMISIGIEPSTVVP